MGDALDVVERLPDASLTRVYLLHPDPWPKARHAKRRMVNHGPLDAIAAKLQPGGEFRLGTDDPTYCRWAMMVMNQRRDFAWTARHPQRLPPAPRRLAGDPLRAQGAAAGPRGLVLHLSSGREKGPPHPDATAPRHGQRPECSSPGDQLARLLAARPPNEPNRTHC